MLRSDRDADGRALSLRSGSSRRFLDRTAINPVNGENGSSRTGSSRRMLSARDSDVSSMTGSMTSWTGTSTSYRQRSDI